MRLGSSVAVLAWAWAFGLARAGSAQVLTSSPLPILVVDIHADSIPDDPKVVTGARLIPVGPDGRARLDDVADRSADGGYAGAIAIELRGSSSQDLFPKKGFGVELRGVDGRDTSAALLGMPTEEDWVLHGPYSDKSLIRNAFTYAMARGLPGYAPRTRFVELVLGGEYWGLYLLTESIKRDGGRVDVAKLTAADTVGEPLTGGYILKADKGTGRTFAGPIGFDLPPRGLRGARVTSLQFHYPKPRNILPQQAAYIAAWMGTFEAALAGDDFEDPVRGYAPLIDERSFLDFLFVNEVVKNVDAYRISTFLYKDRDRDDGRLHMGPVWDFNLALGNADYAEADRPAGWQFDFDLVSPDDGYQAPFWYARLWSSGGFRQNAAQRWRTLRAAGEPLSDGRLFGIYDSLAAVVSGEVAARNFERWPVLGVRTWPNSRVPDTHAEALLHAREFLTDRLSWMDRQFDSIVAAHAAPSPHADVLLYPNPGTGKTVRVAGLAPADYPAVLTWYDGLGRRLGAGVTLRSDEPIDTPIDAPLTGPLTVYRIVTNRGAEVTGRWVRIGNR